MRETAKFLILAMVAPVGFAQHAPEPIAESGTALVPVNVIKDNDDGDAFWGGGPVIQVDTNDDGQLTPEDKVYFYNTGVPTFFSGGACNRRDQTWLFQNTNDRPGWVNGYPDGPGDRIRILPKPDAECTACSGQACIGCYAPQWRDFLSGGVWPYKWNDRYYAVAAFTPIWPGPDPPPGCQTNNEFFQLLLGVSDDGITWTWRELVQSNPLRKVAQVAWKPIAIEGTTYFWGFVGGGVGGPGGIRFRHDVCTNPPWCFASNSLEVWTTANQWVTVPTCASLPGNASPYDFCLYTDPANQTGSAIVIKSITPSDENFHTLHQLAHHGGIYESWAHIGRDLPPNSCGCNTPPDSPPFAANQFIFRQIYPPTTLADNPEDALGVRQELREDDTPARCLPGRMRQTRFGPFRLEWAADILYSRARENPSDPFACPSDQPHYVVRTLLKPPYIFADGFESGDTSEWSLTCEGEGC